MIRRLSLGAVCGLLCLLPQVAGGQTAQQIPDSIAVRGNRRVSRETIVSTAGLVAGRPVGYRDVQHALQALFATGQFQDIRIDADTSNARSVLAISVRERPILIKWTLKGTDKISDRSVRERVTLFEGRPLDPAAVAYADRLLGTRALREWYADALDETIRDLPHEDDVAQVGRVLEDLRAT